MSRTQDFLESYIRHRFDREVEEENIIRSLSFFATSLGALLAALGVMATRHEGMAPLLAATFQAVVLLILLLVLGTILL